MLQMYARDEYHGLCFECIAHLSGVGKTCQCSDGLHAHKGLPIAQPLQHGLLQPLCQLLAHFAVARQPVKDER